MKLFKSWIIFVLKYSSFLFVTFVKVNMLRVKNSLFLLFVLPFLFLGTFSSCKKPVLLSKGNLFFSTDTLVFDTVFTTIGSTTQQFKIYNASNRTVNIEEIELMGGEDSPFRINIDGNHGPSLSNIELEGNDSLFAFVEVTLNVNAENYPVVIEDSIRFRTNGIDQYVVLAVWGQNAYFHYHDLNDDIDNPWFNDKPHVIYGYAAVDSAKTLTIPAGTDIYLHKNALLIVYKSTLNISGTLGNEVTFQGDRLEAIYDDVPGQYYGIYFHEAKPSTINYAIIKNGTSGIHLFSRDQTSPGYTLTMTNTIIENNARYGVFIYSGAKVKAENCVIAKNENHALLVLEGGDFNFNFCSLLGYSSGGSTTPAVGISNFYNDVFNGVTNVGSINEGVIRNSVIYGFQEGEIAFDTISDAAITLSFDIEKCLIRRSPQPSDNFYSSIIWNIDPQFQDVNNNDFRFWSTSPLNNAGIPGSNTLPTDIRGVTRSSTPDIGAYEN